MRWPLPPTTTVSSHPARTLRVLTYRLPARNDPRVRSLAPLGFAFSNSVPNEPRPPNCQNPPFEATSLARAQEA